mmetsp:Transcript_21050/g.23433  ORF Transcript_21050/g.23433 Transcript_21050/m.23433 type:complete len:243 (+) Transcript_21050:25-753(+)
MDSDLKNDLELRNHDGIFILYLNTKENRFNPTYINKIHDALDIVEANKGPTALITISTSSKIWSNGLDLDYWKREGDDKGHQLVSDFIRLCGRLLVFPCPTIACINGHAFAGGCMFAMAHDYRYMLKGKGFICLPEIDLNMNLPRGMSTVCQVKCTPQVFLDLIYGRRFTSEEAEEYRLITRSCNKKTIFEQCYTLAKEKVDRGVNKKTLKELKYQAYKEAYEACRSGDLKVDVKPVMRAKI